MVRHKDDLLVKFSLDGVVLPEVVTLCNILGGVSFLHQSPTTSPAI